MEKKMKIKALKLVTGEEIIGEVESISEYFTIKNPVGISVVRGQDGRPNVGFSPFPLYGSEESGKSIDIHTSNVVYSYDPAEDFVTNYNQIFGSGIVLPPKKTLITG